MRTLKDHNIIDSLGAETPRAVFKAVLRIMSDMGSHKPLTVICIGTDRSTGDSLGPLVGSMLENARFPGPLFGTLDNPVHAGNLGEAISRIDPGQYTILGVDACLGLKEEVGSIIVKKGSLKPGLGVKKSLPPVGDLHIAGVVNVGGFMEYMVLQNTRLSLVMKMARAVAQGIMIVSQHLENVTAGRTITPEAPKSVLLRPLPLEAYDLLR